MVLAIIVLRDHGRVNEAWGRWDGGRSRVARWCSELKLPQEMTPLPRTGGGDITENNAGLQPYVNKQRRHEWLVIVLGKTWKCGRQGWIGWTTALECLSLLLSNLCGGAEKKYEQSSDIFHWAPRKSLTSCEETCILSFLWSCILCMSINKQAVWYRSLLDAFSAVKNYLIFEGTNSMNTDQLITFSLIQSSFILYSLILEHLMCIVPLVPYI